MLMGNGGGWVSLLPHGDAHPLLIGLCLGVGHGVVIGLEVETADPVMGIVLGLDVHGGLLLG
jgi:hypothetical protein